VIKCAKGIGGEAVGCAHANPFFDTREYEVEFTDGTIEAMICRKCHCREHVCTG
jgi:hypothetical protein